MPFVRVLLLASLVAVLTAHAQTRVPPDDIVVLEMAVHPKEGCGEAKLDFVRLLTDGGVAPGYFRVPEGRVLVVTDVDWNYYGGAPGTVQILAAVIENRADPAKRRRAFESTIRLGNDGAGGASERLMTGFVVSSAARLCVETRNPPLGSPLRLSKVIVRGYLSGDR